MAALSVLGRRGGKVGGELDGLFGGLDRPEDRLLNPEQRESQLILGEVEYFLAPLVLKLTPRLEQLAQLRIIAREAEHPVRGAVFMGMGEPLLNYENVIRAARIMSDPAGPAIAAKAISISTAGVLPAIRRFTAEGHRYRLILSLGAPTSEQRRVLMPIEDRWPLSEVISAMREHAAARGQRVTLAYVVLGGVNATPAHAHALGALIGETRVKLNLIDVSDDTGRYRRATPEELAAFRDALDALGVPVVRRYSGGRDIGAACGTLAATRRGGDLFALRPRSAGPG